MPHASKYGAFFHINVILLKKIYNTLLLPIFFLTGVQSAFPHENDDKTGKNKISQQTMKYDQIEISSGESVFTVDIEDNSSSRALIELLKKGSIILDMSDYAGMEKVGRLPVSLPENNRNLNTSAGDVILYQGNHFVIYYGNNSWPLTPIGKIKNVTKKQLLDAFGKGSVRITLSLPND